MPGKWAVLAYVVADEMVTTNVSLDDAARRDLEQLLFAANPDDVQIAAQIDYRDESGVWRHQGTNRKPIGNRERNAATVEALKDFLEFGRKECPADHYLLMLWGHGTGPAGLFTDTAKNSKSPFANPLSPRYLANALRSFEQQDSGKSPFDILLIKACYACTVEMAVQLKGACDFMIASQNLVPSQTFWPYAQMLEQLHGVDAKAVARRVVDVIGDFYAIPENRPEKTEVPYALLDIAAAQTLLDPLTGLVQALRKNRFAFMNAGRQNAVPGDPALIDLVTFCDNLVKVDDQDVSAAAGRLRDEAKRSLIVARRPDPSAFKGVSLFYHPGYAVRSGVRDSALFGVYKRSRFALETGWYDIAYQETVISQIAGGRQGTALAKPLIASGIAAPTGAKAGSGKKSAAKTTEPIPPPVDRGRKGNGKSERRRGL